MVNDVIIVKGECKLAGIVMKQEPAHEGKPCNNSHCKKDERDEQTV